ncbi:MAG: hypothetical protein AABX54_02920 [Nanoarchaeota archaeon]
MKKRDKKIKIIDWIFIALIILIIILIFTAVDYYIHTLKEDYSVPSYYFKNKIIFGTLIGFITYFFIRKISLLKKALIFSAIISVLLQTRYYLEGYSKIFIFEFLIFHFLILLLVSFIIFRLLKNKI